MSHHTDTPLLSLTAFNSPSHVITLIRNGFLPPNEASFKVPLRFTKFDLRDYLYNLYNVEATKIRSYVKEKAIVVRGNSRRAHRPQPDKIMIVELAKPFQWPDLPEDLEPWNNELWHKRQDELNRDSATQAKRSRFKTPLMSRHPFSKERKGLAALAEKMLSGEVKWSNDVILDPKWDKLVKKQATKDEVDEKTVDQATTETRP